MTHWPASIRALVKEARSALAETFQGGVIVRARTACRGGMTRIDGVKPFV